MKNVNGLPGYLSALTDEERARFADLSARVSAIGIADSIRKFVFLPNQLDHPDWDDAAAVFWQAVVGMYRSQPRTAGELPLVYWGFHSYDLLARRSANGVLITDRSIYVVDVGRASVSAALADVHVEEFARFADVLDLGVAQLDLKPARRLLDDEAVSASLDYLARVVAAVPPAPETSAEAATPEQLIEGSTLASDFALPSRPADAKRIAKLQSKWKLPADETIAFTLSSATFAGVYGLAVTDRAVYTRDLMEPLERTPLEQVDADAIAWDPERTGFVIAGEQVMPTLPAITEGNRDYVLDLLRRLLRR